MIERNSQIPQFDYSNLRPPQDVFNVKHSDSYIQRGEGKKAVRKIFYNVPWTAYEKTKIAEMNEEIKKQNIKLPADWNESRTVRMIYNQTGDIPKCIESLKAYVGFLRDPKWHTLDSTIYKYLRDGIIYLMGKDKQYRPIVVLNVYKVNLKGEEGDETVRAICHALNVITKHCFVPGHVENWVMLVEVNNAGLFNFPLTALRKVISTAQLYFSSCLEKLYLMNPSYTLNASWNLIKGMMDPETAEKINFLTKKNFNKLQANIDPSQIVKKYGGTHEDLTSFWPPIRFTREPPYGIETEPKLKSEEVIVHEKEAMRMTEEIETREEIKTKEKINTRNERPKTVEVEELQFGMDKREPGTLFIHKEARLVGNYQTNIEYREHHEDVFLESIFDPDPAEEHTKNDCRSIDCYDLSQKIHKHSKFLHKEDMKLTHWLANINWLYQGEKSSMVELDTQTSVLN